VESVADNAQPLPLGQVLAEERERQGLSRAEVAQRLHMSAYQVEALEAGDYTRLPKGTFLKGFVRNYAKLLGIEPDSVLSRLAQAAPTVPAPGIVVPSQNIRFDPMADRLSNPYVKAGVLAFAAVLLGFAGMYWWLFIRHASPAAPKKPVAAASNPTPQNIAAAPMSAPEPVVMREAPVVTEAPKVEPPRAEPAKAEPAKAEPAKAEPPKAATKPEPPKAAAPAPRREAPAQPQPQPQTVASTAPGSTLKFRFKGSSWVEIKDGRGKVLLSRLNLPGSETEVSGRPPFTVIVGNAPDVQMTYNDRDFPLEPHTKVAVARFTVE
jgi:cytoskeleton protein RodZ